MYILPELYEVKSAALDDIKYVVNPTFTKAQVSKLDKENEERYTITNEKYIPGKFPWTPLTTGFVGLNNLKANDYMNVIIQELSHVSPLRNFFILENLDSRSELGKPLVSSINGSQTIQCNHQENLESTRIQGACFSPRIRPTSPLHYKESIPR